MPTLPASFSSHGLALAVLLCASLTACQKSSDTAAQTAATPAATAPVATVDTAAATSAAPSNPASIKVQTYVECFNSVDESAQRSITRYASWVKDMKNGPTGKEMVVYGLYSISETDIGKCASDVESAVKKQPALPELDAAAQAYANAVKALGQSVEQAYTYYDRENYKDDKFALGKSMHPTLAAQAQAFSMASEAFSAELDVENDKLLDAEMVQIEKTQGRQLPYLRMASMAKAKKLINLIGMESFDAGLAATQLAEYEKLADEAAAYVKSNPDGVPSGWSSMQRALEDYRKASKERVRRIRDKVPYSDGEKMMLKSGSGWMVEGSQEKANTAYNKLVETSNRL